MKVMGKLDPLLEGEAAAEPPSKRPRQATADGLSARAMVA